MPGVIHIGVRPMRRGQIGTRKNSLLYEVLGRRYTIEYIVVTDLPGYGPEKIYNDPVTISAGLQVGVTYGYGLDVDTGAQLIDLDFETLEGSPYIWVVTATYDTDRLVNAVTDNPLNQLPQINWSANKFERPMLRDASGVPVVSSSGTPFVPPEVYEDSRPTVTIRRNEATFDASMPTTYRDAVNLLTFSGVPPFCAKIIEIGAEKQVSNGVIFWSVTYVIEFRRETYFAWVLDQSFRGYEPTRPDTIALFRDPIDFTPLSEPTLLNGRGYRRTHASANLIGPIANNSTTFNLVTAEDADSFPPGPKPGTPHYNFQIKLDDLEICEVTAGWGTSSWTVTRGQSGTTAIAYPSGALARLEPYYLRFYPHKVLDFTPLSLPTI